MVNHADTVAERLDAIARHVVKLRDVITKKTEGQERDFFQAVVANDADRLRELIEGGEDAAQTSLIYTGWFMYVDPHSENAYEEPPVPPDNLNNEEDMAWPALMMAAFCGHLEVTEILIDAGCPVNYKDQMGVHALFNAAGMGHTEVVRLLIAGGAQLDIPVLPGWIGPLCAVSNAAIRGNADCIRLILEAAGELEQDSLHRSAWWWARSAESYQALMEAADFDIDMLVDNTQTAFCLAAERHDYGSMKFLHESGCDVTLGNGRYRPINNMLHKFKDYTQDDIDETLKCLQLLHESGSPFFADVGAGWCPLMSAVNIGNLEIVQALVEDYGARNVNAISAAIGKAPNDNYDCTEIVELLLKNGSKLESMDDDKDSELIVACKWGRDEVIDILLEAGASVNAESSLGLTPLFALVTFGGLVQKYSRHWTNQDPASYVDIARTLILNGCRLDYVNEEGNSVLGCFGENENEGWGEMLELLLDHGCSLQTPSGIECPITNLVPTRLQFHAESRAQICESLLEFSSDFSEAVLEELCGFVYPSYHLQQF